MRRVVILLVTLAAALVPAIGSAQTPQEGVLLILDASGSMNQETGEGTRLIDEAKNALREIVLRLPSDAEVGLRVYGHRTGNDDPVAGCVDTESIVPVGPIDRDSMIEAVEGFDASGFTPIGLSLQQAADDLGGEGGTIVLVSDGVDTCAPPDPCEVAAELAEQGFITRIHTVGLLLQDPAAEEQLRCIAGASGGTFTDIASVDQILESLFGIVAGAVEGPDSELPFIGGALVRESAPVLEWRPTQFDWSDIHLEATIETGVARWWAVDVVDPSAHFAVDARIAPQADASPDEYLEVQIFAADGEPIGEAHEVLGIVVERPQRLLLREAGDYPGEHGDEPTVTAVTDARSMFPAWEPGEDFFRPTVERFADAGLNGGMYTMWKQAEYDGPLEPGRYYVAVSWESDRVDTSPLELYATKYATDHGPSWSEDRPVAGAFVLDDATDGVGGLHLEPAKSAQPLQIAGLGRSVRSVEVWAPVVSDEPLEYTITLDEGELLLAGTDVTIARCCGEGAAQVRLVGPNGIGRSNDVEFDQGHGFTESWVFRSIDSGDHTVRVEQTPSAAEEPAVALSLFVFPAADDEPGSQSTITQVTQAAPEPGDGEGGGFPWIVLVLVVGGVGVVGLGVQWRISRR